MKVVKSHIYGGSNPLPTTIILLANTEFLNVMGIFFFYIGDINRLKKKMFSQENTHHILSE